MSCKSGVEAWLTFVPLDAKRPFSEEDSGSLTDLFGCKESGQFFTAVEMKLEIEQRSSRSAKQFFCPCCPKSALKIEARGGKGETNIQCATCGWDASSIDVQDVSDLLQRDGDPYPWISAEFLSLVKQIEEQRAENEIRNQTDGLFGWGKLGDSRILRGSSMKRLRGRGHSVMNIESGAKSDECSKEESASRCAQKFARDQEEKERRVFSSWAGPNNEVASSYVKGKPKAELQSLLGDIDADQLVNARDTICAATWFKRDCAARRRVPNPRVTFRSPFGSHSVGVDARQIIPNMSVFVIDECDREWSGTGAVRATITNDTKAEKVCISMCNANEPGEKGEVSVSQNTQGTLEVKPFRLERREAPDVLGLNRACSNVAVIEVNVIHCNGEYVGKTWRVCIFARHGAKTNNLYLV